jgi:hypothetical protein
MSQVCTLLALPGIVERPVRAGAKPSQAGPMQRPTSLHKRSKAQEQQEVIYSG